MACPFLWNPFFALLGSLEANQTNDPPTCLSQDLLIQMEILNDVPTYTEPGEDVVDGALVVPAVL